MKSTLIKLLAGLLVLALVGPSLMGYLTYASNTPNNDEMNASSQATLKFVIRIELFINNTLSLASEYNITIPESLQTNITSAQELIQQAKTIVNEDPVTAVNLAIKAAKTFAPVAMLVHQQLPEDYKKELEKKEIELAIQHRNKLVQKIQVMLRELNQSGINVSEEWNKIKTMQQTLKQAHNELQKGNFHEAFHKVMIVDRVTMTEITITISQKMTVLKGKQLSFYAVKSLSSQMSSIANVINITINRINETGELDENITHLINISLHKNNKTLNHVNRILNVIDENNTNQTILEALYLIQTSLETSGLYLEQAYNYSLQNNASMTIYSLTQAYTVLNSTLEQIREMNILPPQGFVYIMVHTKIINTTIIIEKHCHHTESWTRLMQQLNETYTHLQKAYEKYTNGHMSKMRYKALLTAEKQQLIIMKNRIENKAPQEVIDLINEIIEWINNHQP